MLLNLYIKNFAIINELNINFESGLNIVSGETGSGKTLVLKALNLLNGDRFSKDYLGIFADKTIVEATFTLNDDLRSILLNEGYDADENVTLSRTFTDSSSISKLNNRSCNMKFLASITNSLMDIHGQHSNLMALDKGNYLSMIDNFDSKTEMLKDKLNSNLREISNLNKSLIDLDLSPEEVEREKDLLLYQINEIEEFDFDSYDQENLNKEYKKLTNQKELIETSNQVIDLINESSRKTSFKEMSTAIYDLLYSIEKIDEDIKPLVSDALNIRELIYDLSKQIESYTYTLEIDEERVQIIESLFKNFQILKLKYGRSPEEILNYLDRNKKRLNFISNIENTRKKINNSIDELNIKNKDLAKELTSIRIKISEKLEKRIIEELHEMNMNHIDFKISLKEKDQISSQGKDDIDFLISTNKGQQLKSLSQVSSGGEISRFMLAMKSAMSDHDKIGTIIFDEIDTGISGKTADIVGDKLKKISNNLQLIVISHLAQIAAKSDNHYLLRKEIIQEKTVSNIEHLDTQGKVEEIARLISGSNITEKSLLTAKELLEGQYEWTNSQRRNN